MVWLAVLIISVFFLGVGLGVCAGYSEGRHARLVLPGRPSFVPVHDHPERRMPAPVIDLASRRPDWRPENVS